LTTVERKYSFTNKNNIAYINTTLIIGMDGPALNKIPPSRGPMIPPKLSTASLMNKINVCERMRKKKVEECKELVQ